MAETGDKDTAAANGIKDSEAFVRNLARMIEEAGKAAANYLGPREKGKTADDFGGFLSEAVRTLTKVGEYWMGEPERAAQAQNRLMAGYLGLWASSLKRMMGEPAEPAAEPDQRDKRFADPEWRSNQFFDFIKQFYLITSRWAEAMADEAEGLDPHTRQKAAFYVRQVASALSPSNFALTNPEVLRQTLASNGDNLVRGMHMLAEDIKAGHGALKIRQSDASRFKLGENLAATPGKVIHQNDLCQLIQYKATTKTVLKRPLLMVPPWINKFYILDLAPEKSFIRWCVDQGHTVFVVSWVNPNRHQAKKSFADYMRAGIFESLDAIAAVTGESEVNAVGYCVGGTLLSIALAYAAAKGDTRIASATLFATQVDFSEAGDLKVFVDEEQIAAVEKAMDVRGYLEGRNMHATFNMLRPNDLIWPYVIANYFKGEPPAPFDLLYWNSDVTRMPAANHSFYLRNCYLDNRLSKGEMEIAGVTLDLRKITDPGLQPRHPRGPHRPAALGVHRLVLLRRPGHLCAGRFRPYRRRRQPAGAPQIPVLDRAGAEGRPRDVDRESERTRRLVVALLAEVDREARQGTGSGPQDRQPQIQADRGCARQLRPRQGVIAVHRPLGRAGCA